MTSPSKSSLGAFKEGKQTCIIVLSSIMVRNLLYRTPKSLVELHKMIKLPPFRFGNLIALVVSCCLLPNTYSRSQSHAASRLLFVMIPATTCYGAGIGMIYPVHCGETMDWPPDTTLPGREI